MDRFEFIETSLTGKYRGDRTESPAPVKFIESKNG